MIRLGRPRAVKNSSACFLAAATLLMVCPARLTSGQSPSQKRAAAKAQYERAERLRTALEGKALKERTLDEYTRVVAAFRRVYHITAHAAEVPTALVAVGELQREMGRQFDPKYFQSAIDAYQFLIHEYPSSRFRDDALMTIGRIQQEDLNQLDLAQKTYEELLNSRPHSRKAAEARQVLEEITQAHERERKAASKQEMAKEREMRLKMPQVTSIRHWNAENYTRIVIDVDEQVKYQAARISNPDRIYFDIYKAKLSSTLASKTLDVQSGFLKAMRVAQNQAGVVRLVLEVAKVKDYSVFLLPNPYRLVVDVYGEAPSVARGNEPAPASKPAKAEAEKVPPEPVKTQTARAQPPPEPKPVPAARESAKAAGPPSVPHPTHDGQHSLTRALGLKIGRIVIDPGHGGHDTGTIGPTGFMEKDLCLDLALRLGRIIQERLPGADVVYTREDDTFIPLENRTALANQTKADMFISIHANASRDRHARGVETYYLNLAASDEAMEVAARENALSQASIHELQDLIKKIARNEKVEESRELATEIQVSLVKRLQRGNRPQRNRGVKKAPFVVLIGANMPSVLAEVAFISNPADEGMLKRAENRERVAEGLFHGVQTYLQNINSLTYNQQRAVPASR